jgi:casein kinase II subunit beta
VGISDLPRTARFKVYCPRCEEVYIPKYRNTSVDGAVFGTSFPHVFLSTYPNAVILPPKVYLYTPQICGFKIYGKRGSKFFNAPTDRGSVKVVEESLD